MPRRPLSSMSVALPLLGLGLVCSGAEAAFVASSGNNVGISSSMNTNLPSFVANVPHRHPSSQPLFTSARSTLLSPNMMRDSGVEPTGSGRNKQYSLSDLERLREATRSPEALNMKSDGSDEDGLESSKSEDDPKTNKKGGYRPIEEWDEDLKKKKDGSGMTWEEKLMFDSQRHGNQVHQNDILMRHLHTF